METGRLTHLVLCQCAEVSGDGERVCHRPHGDVGVQFCQSGQAGFHSVHKGAQHGCMVPCNVIIGGETNANSLKYIERERDEKKSAPCEDRTHDLQIMRLTRCLLR